MAAMPLAAMAALIILALSGSQASAQAPPPDYVLRGGAGGEGTDAGAGTPLDGSEGVYKTDANVADTVPSVISEADAGKGATASSSQTKKDYTPADTTTDYPNPPKIVGYAYGTIEIGGGKGGKGGAASGSSIGRGGGGGVAFTGTYDLVTISTAGVINVGKLLLYGGAGGYGGASQTDAVAGGAGGDGGNVEISGLANGTIIKVAGEITGTTAIIGGSGGSGGAENSATNGTKGGDGGSLEVSLAGLIIEKGKLKLSSGVNGTPSTAGTGGTGGALTVTIDGTNGTAADGAGTLSAEKGPLEIAAVGYADSAEVTVTVKGAPGSASDAAGTGTLRGEGIDISVAKGIKGELKVDVYGGTGDGSNAAGGGLIDAQGGKLKIISAGDQTGSSNNADATVQAYGGTATAAGGTATVTAAGGIELSSQGTDTYRGGDVSLVLWASAAATSAAADGGAATIDLKDPTGGVNPARGDIIISLGEYGGSVVLGALGGNGGSTGIGGEAKVYAGNISVATSDDTTASSSSKQAGLSMHGGSGAGTGAGGLAEINAAGKLSVTAGGYAASLMVYGGNGDSSGTASGGGAGKISAAGADVTAKHYFADLSVQGGSGGSASGGSASMTFTGDVNVRAEGDGAGAGLSLGGGKADGDAYSGGTATLTIQKNKKLNIAGTVTNAFAMVSIEAGDGRFGSGTAAGALAKAEVGDVDVTAKDGTAYFSLEGGSAGAVATLAGGDAELYAGNLTVRTEDGGAGEAAVMLSSGKGGSNAGYKFGNVLLELTGNLKVEAASGAGASGGTAGIEAVTVDNPATSAPGVRRLKVGGDLEQSGGDALTGKGGGASSIVFDEVTVTGDLKVGTGTDSGPTLGGGATFKALKSLSAPVIDLTQGGATRLDFYAYELKADQDTLITVSDTDFADTSLVASPAAAEAANGFGPYISHVALSGGKTFGVDNRQGKITIDRISVNGGGGRLEIEDSDNLALASLSASGTALTLVVPQGYDGAKPVLTAGAVDLADSHLTIAGDLSGIAD
ncbi:MAG: hypothetical protein LBW85_05360, partial [Deltaproteobacteria bacterium]|nr:hypothetical protein [Deltaproteobacteria bacterium]